MMYHVVESKREWCESSPRDNEKVLSLVSEKFDMDYEKISEELVKAYEKTFNAA